MTDPEARWWGRHQALAGAARTSNPHALRTSERYAWFQGWDEAKERLEALVGDLLSAPGRIERWDERDDGDEDSVVVLSGGLVCPSGISEFAVRVRDCHEDWGPLQGIVPHEGLTDELYARMCAAVGLNPNHGDDHD